MILYNDSSEQLFSNKLYIFEKKLRKTFLFSKINESSPVI